MKKEAYHVVSKGGGWSVQKSSKKAASVNTQTKVEAVQFGRIIAQRQSVPLIIEDNRQEE